MKIRTLIFALTILLISSFRAQAQQYNIELDDSIKREVANFLISKNILKKTNNIDIYNQMIYVTNLKDLSFKVENNRFGAYPVGASISHTPSFVLLIVDNRYAFYEINNLKTLLPEIINLLSKDPQMNDDLLSNYISNILKFYKSNESKSNSGAVIGEKLD